MVIEILPVQKLHRQIGLFIIYWGAEVEDHRLTDQLLNKRKK